MVWSKERAWQWYNSRPWIRGCNYMSADCANRIDQWQEEGFEERLQTTDNPMVDNAYRMPVNLSLTGEETSERAAVMTDLLTYAKEQRVLFVNGTRSLDTWDDYIADLKEMGYEEAREITQAAYDRAVGK